MRDRFDRQLEQLNNELIIMGELIEKAIEMAINGLVNKDIETAKKAIAFDNDIDEQEKEIENLCLKLLLLQQPVAKDLRLISSALKMITDMERIGDHAADISEITLQLSDIKYTERLDNIKKMAKETTVMLVQSIDAFVHRNMELAKEVIEKDDIVDRLFDEVKLEIIKTISENKGDGEQVTDLLMIAKYFERIGDHATNIAEWVIFSLTGQHENH